MRLVFSIDIASDLETVFSWLADPERAMVWMTSATAQMLSETACA